MTARRWLLPSVSFAALGAALLYREWRRGSLRGLVEEARIHSTMENVSARGARLYDALCGLPTELVFGRIARDAVAQLSEGTILDAGCGPGRLAVRIAELAPGLAVTGLDLAPAMVERARARAAAAGVAGRVRFEVGDVAAMPFRDAQFDRVVSTFSMHHWADVAKGLAEISRVLKPGGRACVYDLTGGMLRHLRHGDAASTEQAAAWFGGAAQDQTWKLGPVPVLRRLCLTRSA